MRTCLQMRPLEGRRIGLLESRKSEQLVALVARFGGISVVAPALREAPTAIDRTPFLERLIAGEFASAIVLTGAGFNALMEEADRRGRASAVVAALARTTIGCRGPKPIAALKRHGLTPSIVTEKPHTTNELLAALERTTLDGVSTALIHYGERNEVFSAALRSRGAVLDEICLYEWTLPDDVEPIRVLVREAIAGRLDAVLFTSQVQWRHLARVADDMNATAALVDALRDAIVVGAVGPVCASALRDAGIVADVIPPLPNSASLVSSVAEYFEFTR